MTKNTQQDIIPIMTNRSPLFISTMYMLSYTLAYSALWACIRYLSHDIHPLVLVFFRTFFGMIVILPILFKSRLPALSSGLYPLYILRGFLNTASVVGAFFALSYIPLADAVAYSYGAPIYATILAVFIFKEKIGKHRILAILMAFIGVLILVRPGFQTINIGILAALGASICFAATLICIKILIRHDNPSIVSLMGFIVGVPISAVGAVLYWQWPTAEQWLLLLLMGSCAAIAHICLAKALSRVDISAIMPIDFTRIIFAAILGITLFDDPLSILTIIGGTIILGSAVYATNRERRNAVKKTAEIAE